MAGKEPLTASLGIAGPYSPAERKAGMFEESAAAVSSAQSTLSTMLGSTVGREEGALTEGDRQRGSVWSHSYGDEAVQVAAHHAAAHDSAERGRQRVGGAEGGGGRGAHG